MILAQRRAGVVGATLRAAAAFVVLGIVWHGSAVAVERPSRKTTPQRTLRSTTNPPPLPVDASPLRMRVETSEGVLVVFDAATMADDPPTCSGYLAYWQPVGLEGVYVYGQVLEHPGDVAAALRALEYALDVDLELLADSDDRVAAALAREPEDDEAISSWGPVTTLGVVEIMGFDAEDEFTRVDEPYDGGVAIYLPCEACAAGIGPPRRCDSPRALAEEALSVVAGCCGDGGPPPGGGGDPCAGSSDPCCGSSDPCCRNPCSCGPVPGRCCDSACSNCDPNDCDSDGIPNNQDSDIDGDGIPNNQDSDMDGDGIPNNQDSDMDGDGLPNDQDGDVDGDGIRNSSDPDIDGDGTPNDSDGDADGDGIPNESDPEPGGCTTDCPGACCTKATGACASKKKSECTGETVYFKGKEKPCSPNPCCAFGSNPVFQAGTATIRETTPSHVLANNELGWCDAEYFELSDVSTSARCDGSEWCAILIELTGPYSLQARLAFLEEVTGPGGNTTRDNFCIQVIDLKGLAYYAARYYMLAAIVAHENVHKEHLLPSLQTEAPAIEQLIERACVSHTPGMTVSAAVAEIRKSSAFRSNVMQAGMWWRVEYRSFATLDHSGPTDVAEHTAVDWMWQWICSHAESQCWPVCSQCPLRATGACCNPTTGGCTTKTRCDCEDIGYGGIYQGNDITCGPPNPCAGACCGPGPLYPCAIMSRSTCTDQFRGEGTICSPNPCGPCP